MGAKKKSSKVQNPLILIDNNLALPNSSVLEKEDGSSSQTSSENEQNEVPDDDSNKFSERGSSEEIKVDSARNLDG